MIPPIDHTTGYLPPGRYRTSLDEIEQEYAEVNDHRRELWAEWSEVTTFVRGIVPVAMVWIGGSFLSSKDAPGDVDCVYILEEKLLDGITDPRERMTMQVIASNATQSVWGRRIDTFVIPWYANATPQRDIALGYYTARGYWDDFWGRTRSSGSGNKQDRQAAMPRRGYLEVSIDGFQETGHVFTG